MNQMELYELKLMCLIIAQGSSITNEELVNNAQKLYDFISS